MKTSLTTVLVFSALLLAGCEMSTPSQVEVRQIELRNSVKTEKLDAARPDATRAATLGASYLRNGSGPASLVVSYLGDSATDADKAKSYFAAGSGPVVLVPEAA